MARYFLAYLIFTSCLVAGQSPKYVLKGLEVNLKPDITEQPDQILWKHNGNKVVEFDGREQMGYSPFKNRITLDWFSAELDITDLRFEDSGDYDMEAYMNKKLHHSHFLLEVIDKVAKPTISCEMNNGSSSSISGRLLCSAEPILPNSLTKFEWSSHGNVQLGPQLTISLGDKHDDEVYSCRVSNPLSNETATFTAKNCYPETSSSVALIASLIVTIFTIILLVLAIVFCKLQRKACFAKRKSDQSPPGTTEGSDKKAAEDNETKPLLDSAPTLSSIQPLCQGLVKDRRKMFEPNNGGQTDEHEKTAPPAASPRSKLPSHLDPNNLASNDKVDADADQLPQCDPSDSEKANEPDPADVLGDFSEDTQSDLESSTTPKQPESDNEAAEDNETKPLLDSAPTLSSIQPLCQGLVKDRRKMFEPNNGGQTDEHEKTAPPAASPRSKLPSHLDPNNLASNDKVDADADQLPQCDPSDSEKANEPDPADVLGDFSEDTQSDLESSTTPKQPESDKEADEEEEEEEEAKSPPANGVSPPTAQPCSPLDTSGYTNSDQVNRETAVLQNSLETSVHEQDSNLSQEETLTREGNQQETDKQVSAVENESDSVGDPEEKDKEQNLYLATSQQPQSPTPTQPDNRNTNTFQESPDTAHSDLDREEDGKTSQDLEDQSDSSTAEADEENEGLNDGQSAAPEEQGSDKEADEEEEAQSPPASAETSPSAQPRFPLTKSSPNMAPKDTAGEHKEEADSDLVSEETVIRK